MFKKIFFIIQILFIFSLLPVEAYDAETPIRVGLSDTTFSKYVFEKAEFYSEGQIEVTDESTGESFSATNSTILAEMKSGKFSIYNNGKLKLCNLQGPIIIKTDKHSLIEIKNHKRIGKPACYRGIIELKAVERKSNGFAIVNVLDLQKYLKGVVPNEMPVSFGIEALKAQSIAARNYALRPRKKFYEEFDICDSVACQVYFGAKTERELSNKAVEETDGLVALYEGELILAVYSSTSGGYTESHANAFSDPNSKEFPGNDVPYLQAQPDIPDMKSLEEEQDAREFYTTTPETYDNKSPYFRWTREWTLSEFITMLNKTMLEQSVFTKPEFTACDEFKNLKEIKIKKRGTSGKVMFIEIITENGTYTIGKELTLRRLFKKDGKALPSANFVCDIIQEDNSSEPKIKFTGGGFGHGVGMSQYGAGKMGQAGLNFISILKHYYTGISIGTIPINITSEYGKNVASQTFMSPDGKAEIVIDTIKGVKEFTIIVNGLETDLGLGKFFKKTRIDISKHLNKGINTVEFNIPADCNGEKEMTLHIEIQGER